MGCSEISEKSVSLIANPANLLGSVKLSWGILVYIKLMRKVNLQEFRKEVVAIIETNRDITKRVGCSCDTVRIFLLTNGGEKVT